MDENDPQYFRDYSIHQKRPAEIIVQEYIKKVRICFINKYSENDRQKRHDRALEFCLESGYAGSAFFCAHACPG